MAYKIKSPLPVEEGGTEVSSFTAWSVVCGGTTSTGPLQSTSASSSSYEVLTSQGAGSLPIWSLISNKTFFELLSSDPASPTAGQVWYNTTTNIFKGAVGSSGVVWMAKTSMNTARDLLAAAGTPTDGLSFGGRTTPEIVSGVTERYDGGANTWTAKTSLNTARRSLMGSGTAADALSFGGYDAATTTLFATTERYDGGSNTWTEKTNMNAAIADGGGAGTAGDALQFGGNISGSAQKKTERYDGTGNTWTNKTGMNVSRSSCMGTSDDAADALAGGGWTNPDLFVQISSSESYDGSANSWTSKASLNNAVYGAAGAGSSASSVLSFGGYNGTVTGATEEYNGVSNSWTVKSSMNTARLWLAGCGTVLDALSCGGQVSGTEAGTTERYTDATGVTIVTFDVT